MGTRNRRTPLWHFAGLITLVTILLSPVFAQRQDEAPQGPWAECRTGTPGGGWGAA